MTCIYLVLWNVRRTWHEQRWNDAADSLGGTKQLGIPGWASVVRPAMQRPTLTELSAFLAVGKQRSFRKAADELGVSPSTLSHMMRDLEKRIGARLWALSSRYTDASETK